MSLSGRDATILSVLLRSDPASPNRPNLIAALSDAGRAFFFEWESKVPKPKPRRKVLFLDIDGVLVTNRSLRSNGKSRPFDREAVGELNRVLTETGAKIVVSSSWRRFHPLPRLREILILEGVVPRRVIGITPRAIGSGPMRLSVSPPRGHEIRAWLDLNPVASYAVVDDDADMDSLDRGRFVQTSFDTGLGRAHADRLIEILRLPLPSMLEQKPQSEST